MSMYLEGNVNRLDKLSTRALIRLWIEIESRKKLYYFKIIFPIFRANNVPNC